MRFHCAKCFLSLLLIVPANASGQNPRPASRVASPTVAISMGPAHLIGSGHDFTRVSGAAFGPNGLLAIAQPQDGQVLLFDLATASAPIVVAGRRGEGPGEFSSLGSIGWIGNTLWASDGSRPRAEFFDVAGRVLGSGRFDPPRIASRHFRYFAPTAILTDTAVVYFPAMLGFANGVAPANADSSAPILLQRRGAIHPDTLAQLRPLKSMLVLRGDLGSSVGTQPFSPRNLLQTGMNGQRVLLVLGAAGSIPDGRVLVRVVTSAGTPIFSTDLGLQGCAITTAMWDSVMAYRVKDGTKDLWSTEAKARAGLAGALVRPRFTPVISDAVLGQDGTVWLRLATEQNRRAIWRVLSPTGSPIGSVTLPTETRILDVTATKAVGVAKDADGVEQPFWMTVGLR